MASIAIITDAIRLADNITDKENILAKNKDDFLLRQVLLYGYHPLVRYGLSDWTPKNHGTLHGKGISKFMDTVKDILNGMYSDKERKINVIEKCLAEINDIESDLFINMLNKSLDTYLGLNIDSVKNAIPGLIFDTWPVQKPVKFKIEYEEIVKSWPKPILAQYHSQGLRINVVVSGGKVDYITSSGKKLFNLRIWDDQFLTLSQGRSVVYDGHMVALKFNKRQCDIIIDEEQIRLFDPKYIRFIFWDYYLLDKFISGKENYLGYDWRFNALEHAMLIAHNEIMEPCYSAQDYIQVKNIKQVMRLAIQHNTKFVVKNRASIWNPGTTEDQFIISKDDYNLFLKDS